MQNLGDSRSIWSWLSGDSIAMSAQDPSSTYVLSQQSRAGWAKTVVVSAGSGLVSLLSLVRQCFFFFLFVLQIYFLDEADVMRLVIVKCLLAYTSVYLGI